MADNSPLAQAIIKLAARLGLTLDQFRILKADQPDGFAAAILTAPPDKTWLEQQLEDEMKGGWRNA